MTTRNPSALPRRTVLATGAVGVASATGLLAACGDDDSDSGSTATSSAPTTEAPTSAAPTTSAPTSAAATPSSSAGALASTSDIPVGGGKIFTNEKVVVTQPTSGDFKAFSAVCTHQGCIVATVADGVITCKCHNSTFSASTGAVESGPATSSLPAETITVTGTSITLG
jgi:Rieske Fe-S protein